MNFSSHTYIWLRYSFKLPSLTSIWNNFIVINTLRERFVNGFESWWERGARELRVLCGGLSLGEKVAQNGTTERGGAFFCCSTKDCPNYLTGRGPSANIRYSDSTEWVSSQRIPFRTRRAGNRDFGPWHHPDHPPSSVSHRFP